MGFFDWLFGTQTTTTIDNGQDIVEGQWEEQNWVVPGGDMVPVQPRQPIHIDTGMSPCEYRRQMEEYHRQVEEYRRQWEEYYRQTGRDPNGNYWDSNFSTGQCTPDRSCVVTNRAWTDEDQRLYNDTLTWGCYADNS